MTGFVNSTTNTGDVRVYLTSIIARATCELETQFVLTDFASLKSEILLFSFLRVKFFGAC